MPMNPDVKPGVRVRAKTDVLSPLSGMAVANKGEEAVLMPRYGFGERQIRVYTDDIGCNYDLTGCFEVIPEKREMTVREVAEVLYSGAGGKLDCVDDNEFFITLSLHGKEAAERLLSEKMGVDVEIEASE